MSGYIHAMVRDDSVAKDIVQETALALLRKFPAFDPLRAFLPWALGAAKFEIMGYRRDAGRCRLTFDDALLTQITEAWSEAEPQMGDEEAALHTCLEKLARHARNVVQLRYFDSLDSLEIAQRLGSTAGAVRAALQRIRVQLRECVERQLGMEGGAA